MQSSAMKKSVASDRSLIKAEQFKCPVFDVFNEDYDQKLSDIDDAFYDLIDSIYEHQL
jgi:hypothetical protein